MYKIIFDPSHSPWKKYNFEDINIYLAGNIILDEIAISEQEAAIYLKNIFEEYDFSLNDHEIFTELNGQFSFIYESKDQLLIFMDRIRSFPLFYSKINKGLLISNNAHKLNEENSSLNINPKGLQEFRMSGYTLGSKTIYKEINQFLAGEFVLVDKELNMAEFKRYFNFYDDQVQSFERKDLLKKINDTINQSIQETIKVANGRTIIVPLSAGLDSRIILGKLKEFNYSKIFCYTYGPKHIWEAKVAKRLAEQANVPWEFVQLSQKDKKLFNTEDRKRYYTNYSGYCSIPHLSDYYALQKLEEKGHIHGKDCIVVNGQSGDFISGSHIPKGIHNLSNDVLFDTIIHKHFALWSNLINSESKAAITDEINHQYELNSDQDSTQIKAKKIEFFECHERQFKYVINGQRAYDHLGYSWHLPLWSNSMLSFWKKIDISDKMGQDAYKEYCKVYNPFKLFDIKEKKSHNCLPPLIQFTMICVKILNRINPRIDKSGIKRTYFNFFDKYAPYYPMKKYSQYLIDSKYHRHCVSYWTKYFLEENGIK